MKIMQIQFAMICMVSSLQNFFISDIGVVVLWDHTFSDDSSRKVQ